MKIFYKDFVFQYSTLSITEQASFIEFHIWSINIALLNDKLVYSFIYLIRVHAGNVLIGAVLLPGKYFNINDFKYQETMKINYYVLAFKSVNFEDH